MRVVSKTRLIWPSAGITPSSKPASRERSSYLTRIRTPCESMNSALRRSITITRTPSATSPSISSSRFAAGAMSSSPLDLHQGEVVAPLDVDGEHVLRGCSEATHRTSKVWSAAIEGTPPAVNPPAEPGK